MSGMYTTESLHARRIEPTRETYDAFQQAYDHFNWTLFDSKLPNCLITLQRKGRTYGYFCRKRFVSSDDTPCDEIALNPAVFHQRSVEETLSTLVHEMVHLWQFHFGSPGRGRYHNRQWAEKMKSIGLQPSHTGAPGGNELGDQMSHYIIENGSFANAAKELTVRDFRIEWRDRGIAAALGIQGGSTISSPITPKSGKRVKYTCQTCGQNAWANHNANLICGDDQSPMEAA